MVLAIRPNTKERTMMQIVMRYDQATKNTYRYKAETDEFVPVVYIRKEAFNTSGGAPAKIVLEIKPTV
jgi:hypothetical protein